MFDWISDVIASIGSAGVALLMVLENVFPPIPSELIMPMSGFIARRGEMSLWGVIAAGSIGSLAGAIGWYYVGRRIGERRLRDWVDRHGRWLALSGEDIDRAARWFDRRGGAAVFVGRLIPGVRTFVSVPAGFAKMPLLPFLTYSALGTVLWTSALAAAGFMLGARYEKVSGLLDIVTWVVLGAVLVAYLRRVVRRRGEARAGPR
jgi:membrane protein DedA with SNARE-associated domain